MMQSKTEATLAELNSEVSRLARELDEERARGKKLERHNRKYCDELALLNAKLLGDPRRPSPPPPPSLPSPPHPPTLQPRRPPRLATPAAAPPAAKAREAAPPPVRFDEEEPRRPVRSWDPRRARGRGPPRPRRQRAPSAKAAPQHPRAQRAATIYKKKSADRRRRVSWIVVHSSVPTPRFTTRGPRTRDFLRLAGACVAHRGDAPIGHRRSDPHRRRGEDANVLAPLDWLRSESSYWPQRGLRDGLVPRLRPRLPAPRRPSPASPFNFVLALTLLHTPPERLQGRRLAVEAHSHHSLRGAV